MSLTERDAPVDELDRQLVERLRCDGRESNRSLAAALGVNESTVAARLRRLASAGVMRVVAVADMEAFGMGCLAFAFVRVRDRVAREVASELAELPQTTAVLSVTGADDIIVTLLTRDTAELAGVLAAGVGALPGVAETHCELAVDVLRYDSQWAGLRFADPDPAPFSAPGQHPLDLAIVTELQHDARASNRSIATRIGVSEATVRTRLRRLEDEGFIRIQAVCDVESFGINASGFVGVRAAPGATARVEDLLSGHPELGMIARTIGRYDYVAIVATESRARALDTVLHQIAGHDAVADVDLHETHAIFKHLYTWARLGSAGASTNGTASS